MCSKKIYLKVDLLSYAPDFNLETVCVSKNEHNRRAKRFHTEYTTTVILTTDIVSDMTYRRRYYIIKFLYYTVCTQRCIPESEEHTVRRIQ